MSDRRLLRLYKRATDSQGAVTRYLNVDHITDAEYETAPLADGSAHQARLTVYLTSLQAAGVGADAWTAEARELVIYDGMAAAVAKALEADAKSV